MRHRNELTRPASHGISLAPTNVFLFSFLHWQLYLFSNGEIQALVQLVFCLEPKWLHVEWAIHLQAYLKPSNFFAVHDSARGATLTWSAEEESLPQVTERVHRETTVP